MVRQRNLDHYLSTIVFATRNLAAQRWFAVREYDLSVRTDPARRALSADVMLTIEVTAPSTGPIWAFLGIPGMNVFRIEEVTLDGVVVPFSYPVPQLEVPLATHVEVGQTLLLGVSYEGTVAAPQTYVTPAGSELSFEGLWLPVVNFPGLRFHARACIDVPAGETCAFAANEVLRVERGGRVITRWETDVPVTHLTLVSGPFETHELSLDSTRVRVFAHGAYSRAAQLTTELVLDVVELGTEWFGPLLNHEVLLAYTPRRRYGHYTHVPLLVLNSSFFTDIDEKTARQFVRLISWDLGHFWWGYAVRTDVVHEGWLSDGLAGFLALLALEERCGPAVAHSYLEGLARSLRQLGATPPLATIPINDPRYPMVSRCRSLLCLASLRQHLGDPAMKRFTRALYKRHRGGIMRTTDFVESAARTARAPELPGFINEHLYQALHYRVNEDGTINAQPV